MDSWINALLDDYDTMDISAVSTLVLMDSWI